MTPEPGAILNLRAEIARLSAQYEAAAARKLWRARRLHRDLLAARAALADLLPPAPRPARPPYIAPPLPPRPVPHVPSHLPVYDYGTCAGPAVTGAWGGEGWTRAPGLVGPLPTGPAAILTDSENQPSGPADEVRGARLAGPWGGPRWVGNHE